VKVALITPWPPQRSGIADYAYQLARGLAVRGVEVSVVTSAPEPMPLAGCEIRICTGRAHVDVAGDALPVFQLGNNITYHDFQPKLLLRLGGLVQLHDLVLHHFHVDRTLPVGSGAYWNDLRFWYGPGVVAAVRKLRDLGAPPWVNATAAAAIPMFEPYLQHADAVVVHSRSALSAVAERLPELRAWYLPQCYLLPKPSPRAQSSADRPLRLGVFGWIERHKRIDLVLEALADLRRRGIGVELEVCGQIGGTVTALEERIASLGLGPAVHLRGRLEHDAFLAAIRSVDVCVNLRDPTMGETSAVVTQALQMGTPVIASDVGWYAELPECVLKVPVGDGAAAALVGHISRLANDREGLAELSDATLRFATTHLDFHAVVARYADIMAELAAERSRRRALDRALYADAAQALADLNLANGGSEEAIRSELMRTLTPCL